MDKFKVSVIMPVFNGEKYIVKAIESVLNQSYKNYEIIIIDDGSTDNTIDKIRSYLTFSNVKYIKQKNSGVASARNAGIRASSGEYIAFLDQDDLWMPCKLEVQVEFMKKYSEVGLVHGNISYIDEHDVPFTPNPPYQTDISGNCFAELFMGNRIAVLTVLIRKHCLADAGFFDDHIQYADDYDMWLRIARRYPLGHVDQCLAIYRKHPGSASRKVIAHNVYVLKVLKKTLKEFPDTRQIVGNERVNGRLFYLTNHLAAVCFNSGNYISALCYFLKAIKIDIAKFGPLYVHTFLTFIRKTIFRKKVL